MPLINIRDVTVMYDQCDLAPISFGAKSYCEVQKMLFEINQFLIQSDIELPLKSVISTSLDNRKQIKVFRLNKINIHSEYYCVLSKNSNIDVYLYDNVSIVNYKSIDVKLEISSSYIAYSSDQPEIAILPILSMGIAIVFNYNGMSPIHAAGFYYNGNAYVLAGDSGSGKSSLLASIISNNKEISLICDDLLPIISKDKKIFSVGSNGFIKQWKYNIINNPWLDSLEWEPLQLGVDKYYSYCDTTINSLSKISCMFVLNPMECKMQTYFQEICDYKEKATTIFDKYYCKNFMYRDKSFLNNIQNGLCFSNSVKIYNAFYTAKCPKDSLAKDFIEFIEYTNEHK